MHILICEDDGYMMEQIAYDCRKYLKPDDRISCYISSKHLKEYILEETPKVDLFLLDIEMPEVSGIELKELISAKYADTSIAFLTSHDEMMEDAFGKKVIAFLKKSSFKERLEEVIGQVRLEVEDTRKVLIEEGMEKRAFLQKEILAIDAERVNTMLRLVTNYNEDMEEIVTENKIYRISLREWEQQLDETEFYRVNRSSIISWRYVKRITKQIEMVDGSQYSIPAGKMKQLRAMYQQYCEGKVRYL